MLLVRAGTGEIDGCRQEIMPILLGQPWLDTLEFDQVLDIMSGGGDNIKTLAKIFVEHEEEMMHIITGKNLLERYNALYQTFNNDYNYVKYAGKLHMTDAQWEKHPKKWKFIELAKHFEAQASTATKRRTNFSEITISEFNIFFTFIAGEGYDSLSVWPDPVIFDDMCQGIGLSVIFQAWNEEQAFRYALLAAQLENWRDKNNIISFQQFKKSISTDRSIPLFFECVAYIPEKRQSASYQLSLQSFFLINSQLHLLDLWNTKLCGDPHWDSIYKRVSIYEKLYFYFYPINNMKVRQTINEKLNLA